MIRIMVFGGILGSAYLWKFKLKQPACQLVVLPEKLEIVIALATLSRILPYYPYARSHRSESCSM